MKTYDPIVTEERLDQILVNQKNDLLDMINEADDKLCRCEWDEAVTDYKKILCLLRFVDELWVEASYGYKFNEVLDRIKDSIRRHLDNCNPRRNAYLELQEVYRTTRDLHTVWKHNV